MVAKVALGTIHQIFQFINTFSSTKILYHMVRILIVYVILYSKYVPICTVGLGMDAAIEVFLLLPVQPAEQIWYDKSIVCM